MNSESRLGLMDEQDIIRAILRNYLSLTILGVIRRTA